MINSFYGFTDLKEFEDGIRKLREDLHELTTTKVPEHEIKEYDILLLKGRPGDVKGFWAYDNPGNMPSDCRVAYAYTPTYLATAILMYSWMNYQAVRDFEPLEKLLKDAMQACTGRNFMGHGYEAEEGFIDAMQIFEEAHAEEFVRKYPKFCPEFTNLYDAALKHFEDIKSRKKN